MGDMSNVQGIGSVRQLSWKRMTDLGEYIYDHSMQILNGIAYISGGVVPSNCGECTSSCPSTNGSSTATCDIVNKQNVATYNLDSGNYVKDDFSLKTAPGYSPMTMYRNVPDTSEHKFYIIGG